ncbi:hypothetical protein DFH09DRAFT_1177233 [Mycena vulgaris]|nr:hypothetical protein DFH09DRAFT_1177233 [Mycena vulgaris]
MKFSIADHPLSSQKRDADRSTSTCANCSFPLSESALPTNFDTSGEFAPAQLSHFFPLPPTNLDKTPATSNLPSNASLHKASMTSLNQSMGQASLQETLDALWAPPKHVPVRISAPVSPIAQTDELLIDFSSEPMPTLPSLTSSTPTAFLSRDTSFEIKSSRGVLSGYQSGDSSAFDIAVKTGVVEPTGGVPMCREETLTQLVASHPELDLGPLDSSSKKASGDAARLDSAHASGCVSFVSVGEDEPVQLPPFTYADATNIATKYPELADRVLNEPLATPVQTNIMLQPDEAEQFYSPHEAPTSTLPAEPTPAMPDHTPDHPNWALAPDDPESDYYSPRPPRRDRRESTRHQSSGYAQNQNEFDDRRESSRRQSSGYTQNQNEFDDQWQSSQGHGDSSQRNASQRYSGPPRGYDEKEDYKNAVNGPSRRGWSQEPSNSANDRSHDAPPHLRGNDSHDQSYRLPTRPSGPRMDSMNVAAPVEESAPAVDEWTSTHDPWAPAAEQPAETPQSSTRPGFNSEAVDEWMPKHDAWAVPAEQPKTEARGVQGPPSSQSFHLPTVPETDRGDAIHASAPLKEDGGSANEWVASHDPWAVVADENHGHQPQMLEPNNKREAPSSIRSGGSPFRDRMNDSANQNDRSVNEERFSTNVLDVRAPSQSSVAALAASHAGEMYDRRGPENTRSGNQEEELPAEFNYFLHSETVDWTSSGPTKATQNSFSPSQNLASVATPPARGRSPPIIAPISAPAPRPTDYFDYNQQASDNYGRPAAREDNFKAEIPNSTSFVLGSMKTDRYESCGDDGYRGRERSASQWGPSEERDDGGRGRGRDSASPGYGASFHHGASPSHGRGRRGDDYDGGSPYASRGKGLPSQAEQYENPRGGPGGHDSRGGPGGHDSRGGPRGYDSRWGPRGYDSRGGPEGRDSRGGPGGYDSREGPGGYGSMGPMPPKYSGPPRRTSYGAANFVLPPLDEY